MSQSSRAVKVGRRTVYEWLEDDVPFSKLYADALPDAVDAMEQEAHRRPRGSGW